ncbi:hypothetical protein CW304_30035 [Bacillus sp. UFRGS-B20]|nr:hypothetical protein CW304_30035 [Bacillus sp. UFRGS-B20]
MLFLLRFVLNCPCTLCTLLPFPQIVSPLCLLVVNRFSFPCTCFSTTVCFGHTLCTVLLSCTYASHICPFQNSEELFCQRIQCMLVSTLSNSQSVPFPFSFSTPCLQSPIHRHASLPRTLSKMWRHSNMKMGLSLHRRCNTMLLLLGRIFLLKASAYRCKRFFFSFDTLGHLYLPQSLQLLSRCSCLFAFFDFLIVILNLCGSFRFVFLL